MEAATVLSQDVSLSEACRVLSVSRSSYYRSLEPKTDPKARPKPLRALSEQEKQEVRDVLNGDRFVDASPRQVYATLLDEGKYMGHWRTMYRILAEHDEVKERRNVLRHPEYEKPELLSRGPNELYSWDITKIRGPAKWTYFYLYVIMDVFSRFVVGWMIARRESATLAKELIETTCFRQGIDRNQLVIHSDRGSSMTSKTVAQLMVDLGVEKSLSRPHVPDDNPKGDEASPTESQFKTMKYRGDYPKRFGSIKDARAWARSFFPWYNEEHHHTGLGLLPPAVVHYGRSEEVLQARQRVLSAAFEARPERFVGGMPTVKEVPTEVWINKPTEGPGSEAEEIPERDGPNQKERSNKEKVLSDSGFVDKPRRKEVKGTDCSVTVCQYLHDREVGRMEGSVAH